MLTTSKKGLFWRGNKNFKLIVLIIEPSLCHLQVGLII